MLAKLASNLPGGLVKEHDGRVVDQLQSNGQTLALTTGQFLSSRLLGLVQSQDVQDLVHLRMESLVSQVTQASLTQCFNCITHGFPFLISVPMSGTIYPRDQLRLLFLPSKDKLKTFLLPKYFR